MPDHRHIIHRQRIDLIVPSKRAAHQIQEEVRDAYYRRILPIMDQVFSAVVDEGDILRLDRLELDLGTVAGPHLEEAFAGAVQRHLEETLLRLRHRTRGTMDEYEGPGLVRTTPDDARRETLLVFLQTGSLPWWAAPDAFDPEAALSEVITTTPDALASALRTLDPVVVSRRLVRQFARETWRQLVRVLTPTTAEPLLDALTSWEQMQVQQRVFDVSTPMFRACLWETTLAYLLASGRAGVEVSALLGHVLAQLAAATHQSAAPLLAELETAARKVLTENAVLSAWLRKKVAHREAASGDRTRGQRAADAGDTSLEGAAAEPPALLEADDGLAGLEAAFSRPPNAVAPESARRSGAAGIRAGDSHGIGNAGLVVLWPFLGPFFKSVHLLEDVLFASEAAQRRAVLLTQYLVTGEPASPEHRLVLNKVLCGWPPEEPLERAITLTAEEAAQAQDLLTSIIAHWTALKNTSVEGLRQAFLQRTGELVREESQWLLTVERKAYDVLLGRLPWSLGFVKQRWMEVPIFVEW